MTCKLCEKEKPLVDSHIIPKSFHGFKEDGKALKVLTNVKGKYTRKSPQGEYDQIVCSGCEQSFSSYDDYAFRLFLGDLWQPEEVTKGGQIMEYVLKGVDFEKLKLFALSVLWRAGVSQRSFFKKVELGNFESLLGAILREETPPGKEFEVVFARFTDIEHALFLDPHREKFFGVNYYHIHLDKFVMYIKVDRRPGPLEFQRETLNTTGRLIVVGRKAMENEMRVASRLAKQDYARLVKKK